MNDRIIELARQARLPACHASHPKALERFAELIRQDEREACAEHYLSIMRDAVEHYFSIMHDAVEQAVLKEREVCAQLCEGRLSEGLNFEGCAATIRARGEK